MMSEAQYRLEALQHFDNPFPAGNAMYGRSLTPVSDVVAELKANLADHEPNSLIADAPEVTIACRVVLKRNAGKIVFVTVRSLERDGTVLQLFLNPNYINVPVQIDLFKTNVHIGDVLYVSGRMGYSATSELTLFVTRWQMAAKALNETPKPIKNPETGALEVPISKDTIHENPMLHMLASPEHRERIVRRAVMIQQVRRWFEDHGYLEVETPILSTHAGGAAAAKFTTHSNARDMELYLRIAPELYLKRLVIGGIGNVFEIGKNFRNEGIDSTHSPEFTCLEAYTLHSDYIAQAELMIGVFNAAWMGFQNNPMADAQFCKFFTLLNHELGRAGLEPVEPSTPLEQVRARFSALDLEFSVQADAHHLMEDLFDELVVPVLPETCFVIDYPAGTCPLAYPNEDGTCQKWDFYVRGMEVATAYTENTNPLVQAQTLTEDQDFVHDVRYGMPPMGGIGIGIDRLAMLVCDVSHINAVNPYPHSAV